MRIVLLGFLLTACAHVPAGLTSGAITSGGRARTFLYVAPSGGGVHPLVIALHGRLGQGDGQVRLSHLDEVAHKEGFIAVFPDGVRRSWADARGVGPAAEQGIDDVQFLSELIDDFIATKNADPKRVYLLGMSNGAFMTLTYACRHPEKVAAIVSVTGTMSEKLECATGRAVPVTFFLGDADPLVPWGGGEVAGSHGKALSGEDSAGLWAKRNGCSGVPTISALPDLDPSDGTRVELRTWAGCRDGAEVRLFVVKGGGHTWPGGQQYLGEGIVGRTSRDVDASLEAWAFFQRFSLP